MTLFNLSYTKIEYYTIDLGGSVIKISEDYIEKDLTMNYCE